MNDHTQDNLTNIQAEQALLGAILTNNDAFYAVDGLIGSGDFSEPLHRRIYDSISVMVGSNSTASPVTLKSSIPYAERVGEITIGAYVARLAAEAVSVVQAPDFARAIKQYSIRRTLHGIAQDLMASASKDMPAPELWECLDELDERLAEVASDRVEKSGGEIGDAYLRALNEGVQKKQVGGVPIPFEEVRQVISEDAYEGKNLYGLLAASGEGKTSMLLHLVKFAMQNDHPVLFLSYDQTEEQCIRQMVAQEYEISAKRQRNGDIRDFEFEKAYEFTRWLKSKRFQIIECTEQTVHQLVKLATAFVKSTRKRGNMKTPFIVIDHIVRIRVDDRGAKDEGARARASTGPLKAFAKGMDAAVFLLNQRNSKGSARDNPRPIKADLYGGEPAQYDYDTIMYLYRFKKWRQEKTDIASTGSDHNRIEKVFGPDTEEDIVEIGALKVRFGSPYERRRMRFNAPFTRYESLVVPELIEDPMRPAGRLF